MWAYPKFEIDSFEQRKVLNGSWAHVLRFNPIKVQLQKHRLQNTNPPMPGDCCLVFSVLRVADKTHRPTTETRKKNWNLKINYRKLDILKICDCIYIQCVRAFEIKCIFLESKKWNTRSMGCLKSKKVKVEIFVLNPSKAMYCIWRLKELLVMLI